MRFNVDCVVIAGNWNKLSEFRLIKYLVYFIWFSKNDIIILRMLLIVQNTHSTVRMCKVGDLGFLSSALFYRNGALM